MMRYFAGIIALSLLAACAAPTVMPDGQPVRGPVDFYQLPPGQYRMVSRGKP